MLSAAEVERILAAVDQSTALGRRDYAILLLAARYGLRPCDIRQLTLVALQQSPPPLHRLDSIYHSPAETVKPPPNEGGGIFDRNNEEFSTGIDTGAELFSFPQDSANHSMPIGAAVVWRFSPIHF